MSLSRIRFDGAFFFCFLREIACSFASYGNRVLPVALRKGQNMYFNQVEFGQRIKKERTRLGLTQEELAEQLNIGPVHVYNIENGRKGCSIDLLLEFAELFEVSTDYLLTGRGNMNAEIREHLQGAIDELEVLLLGLERK